jgi:hypothetical protein
VQKIDRLAVRILDRVGEVEAEPPAEQARKVHGLILPAPHNRALTRPD